MASLDDRTGSQNTKARPAGQLARLERHASLCPCDFAFRNREGRAEIGRNVRQPTALRQS